nr:long-chain-fatty-acid--CoA ligase [Klebsiella pneumoniae]
MEETDLLSWFEKRVPKWQIPDRVIFVDALPVSATGKVLKISCARPTERF